MLFMFSTAICAVNDQVSPACQALDKTFQSTFGLLVMFMIAKLSRSPRVGNAVRTVVAGCCTAGTLRRKLQSAGAKRCRKALIASCSMLIPHSPCNFGKHLAQPHPARPAGFQVSPSFPCAGA